MYVLYIRVYTQLSETNVRMLFLRETQGKTLFRDIFMLIICIAGVLAVNFIGLRCLCMHSMCGTHCNEQHLWHDVLVGKGLYVIIELSEVS